jgi:endonuclease/exonuclease/phosphatase family metal-dependent hydrolase/predicted alpha-1,6-mannanase (GH76 family)
MKTKKSTIFLVTLLFAMLPISQGVGQQLRAASYNIRYDNPADSLNNWKYRKATVSKLIRFHDFDVVGTQEGLKHQLEALKKMLPSYDYIGVGRDNGKAAGEHSAIFYKTEMFEVLDKGNFWLSEHPSEPSTGWDAALPRICSWAKFRQRSTGLTFFFFNTHFDHVGTVARKKSAGLILKKINTITDGAPVLLTGDFNVDQESDSYKILNSTGRLTDAYDRADLRYGAEGTYNDFKVNTQSKSRIDHIFVTDDFEVQKHAILTDTYHTAQKDLQEITHSGNYPKEISLYKNKARLPSDHYPVFSILKVNADALSYSKSDATAALEAFNKYFYSEKAKLYYETTEQKDLGSIWTQAIFWDIVMDAYERTGDEKFEEMIHDIYEGGYQEYAGYNWENKKEWFIYDDIMWWVIALARAHHITGNQKYLELSKSGFARVWRDSYDPDNGGMYWNFDHDGKNACINYPTVIAAMRLYNITGEKLYLNKAKKIYSWSRDHLFNKSNGRVADHKVGDNPPGFEDYTYNQGTAIGAAVMLYDETGEQFYLDDAILAADYTKEEMSNDEGILPAEGAWNEQGVLKAIFVRYMDMLIDDAGQQQYLAWLQKNINTAWQNRDKDRTLMYRDYDVPAPAGKIQSYEASSGVGFMQIVPPKSE